MLYLDENSQAAQRQREEKAAKKRLKLKVGGTEKERKVALMTKQRQLMTLKITNDELRVRLRRMVADPTHNPGLALAMEVRSPRKLYPPPPPPAAALSLPACKISVRRRPLQNKMAEVDAQKRSVQGSIRTLESSLSTTKKFAF